MKLICSLLLVGSNALACNDKKKESPKMMPVEADDGIGDGAEHLDSILKYQTPPLFDPKELEEKPKPLDSISC